jgi:inner membrane protein
LLRAERLVAAMGLFMSTISHGVLDAMTTGGLGVAFLSPFSNERFFFEWRVIQVSPIGVSSFFSEWGVRVLSSELVYVWFPCALIAAVGFGFRKLTGKRESSGAIRS